MSLDYKRGSELALAGQFEAAWKIIGKKLLDDPLDVRALVTGSFIMLKLGGLAQAYHFARAATQLAPHDDACWTNLGHAASQMWLTEEAEAAYLQALKVARNEGHKKVLYLNLSALYLDNGQFEEAERYTDLVLSIDPLYKNGLANRGFCQLARRDWANGWKGYRHTIGTDWRAKVQYKDEPEWDGSPGKAVAIYEDQGLGDAVSFASILPDAVKACKKVILDCDPRLAGLFRRSFPKVKVYGTRRLNEVSHERWDQRDWNIEASLPLGQLGEYFRTSADQFSGKPYLTPCPDRVRQWKALFAAKGRPVIGVAWTGGIPKTNARNRRLSLEQLLPALSLNAHYVSLEYKDAAAAIGEFRVKHPRIDLIQYPWGTLTQDYDDTAALIASLDYVICIQTAVAHVAGALGVPATVLVPKATQWRYGTQGDSIPWYSSLRIVRQETHGQWREEIDRAREHVAAHLGQLFEDAGEASRGRELRGDGGSVRALDCADHRANGSDAPPRLWMRELVPGEALEGTA